MIFPASDTDLAYASYSNRGVCLLDFQDKNNPKFLQLAVIPDQNAGFGAVQCSPDGNYLLCTDWFGNSMIFQNAYFRMHIYDISNRYQPKILASWPSPCSAINSCIWSSDSNYVIHVGSTPMDQRVFIWDMRDKNNPKLFPEELMDKRINKYYIHTLCFVGNNILIGATDYSTLNNPIYGKLLTCSLQNKFEILKIDQLDCANTFEIGNVSGGNCAVFFDDVTKKIKFLRTKGKTCLKFSQITLQKDQNPVIHVSSDGSCVIFDDESGISLWSLGNINKIDSLIKEISQLPFTTQGTEVLILIEKIFAYHDNEVKENVFKKNSLFETPSNLKPFKITSKNIKEIFDKIPEPLRLVFLETDYVKVSLKQIT